MVPEKPLMLMMLRVDVPDAPAGIVRLVGLAARAKSAVVLMLNVAVWTASGIATRVPLVMVTHVLGGTLVPVQPV